MRQKSFGEFVDKKKRESVKQLQLLKRVLESNGLKVENFLTSNSEDEPYIFCFSPTRNGSFEGIRLYKIGSDLAFRIQKENKTHPYGSAYPLPVEDMFHDFLSDEDVDQMKAGMKVIEAIVKEVRGFFDKSIEAEKEDRDGQVEKDGDPAGNVLVRTTGTDYSSLVYNKS
jgi:hypothetical protein